MKLLHHITIVRTRKVQQEDHITEIKELLQRTGGNYHVFRQLCCNIGGIRHFIDATAPRKYKGRTSKGLKHHSGSQTEA